MFKAAKTQDQNPDQIYMDERSIRQEVNQVKDIVRTPIWLIDKMIDWLGLDIDFADRVLDPCAGDGRMIKRLRERYYWPTDKDTQIDIKPDSEHIEKADFMNILPKSKYLKAIMNPPFSDLGAYRFTKRCLDYWLCNHIDARLIAIWPEYAVRNPERYGWLNQHVYRMAKIPRDTFKDSGCNALDCWIIDFRHKGSGMIEFWQPDLGQLEL